MSGGNGATGLAYVHGVMARAQVRISESSKRLAKASMPNYAVCPAGGEEYHEAMAESMHANNDGIGAMLEWNRLQVEREMERVNGQRHDRASDQPEIQTKWFRARGAAAMWPVVLMVIVVVVVMVLTKGCQTIDTGLPPVAENTGPAAGVVKRALVVGMRNSQLAGECPGADVDADVAALLFTEQGFMVQRLGDRQATRAAAISAMRDLIAGAEAGSLLCLYWSGHGGQTADRNGDEADGMDEYLCPWDAPLLDDDLAVLFDTIPAGVRVFCIFDTCNSGTMARRALRSPRIANPRTFRASMIVFAGCADGKSSFGGPQGGVFTGCLIDAWGDGVTYRQWFAGAVDMIGIDQVPIWTEYGDVSTWADGPALK